MSLDLSLPIINLITNGSTTSGTTPEDHEFSSLLRMVEVAVATQITLLQIREKNLSARVLYELTNRAVEITRGTSTRLLVNDRSDIASAAGADGVQLTSQSLAADVVRQAFGREFLIGVSTHSQVEVRTAYDAGANFVLFGPVFDTESKRAFGEPQGLERLREITSALSEFPVVAIGGVTLDNIEECFLAGASGVAAIRLLNDATRMPSIVADIRSRFRKLT